MFSAVLNYRLTKFSDEFELITNAQAGFRKGCSTNDRWLMSFNPDKTEIMLLNM
jgi:hypothetical protein